MFRAVSGNLVPVIQLKVGTVCHFVVIDPNYLGTTILVVQAVCLTIFNLSPMQNTCLLTKGNEASQECVTMPEVDSQMATFHFLLLKKKSVLRPYCSL